MKKLLFSLAIFTIIVISCKTKTPTSQIKEVVKSEPAYITIANTEDEAAIIRVLDSVYKPGSVSWTLAYLRIEELGKLRKKRRESIEAKRDSLVIKAIEDFENSDFFKE